MERRLSRLTGVDQEAKTLRGLAAVYNSDSEDRQTDPRQDPDIQCLLEEIRQKHGEALLAILVYGSWLRGKRDHDRWKLGLLAYRIGVPAT